MQLYHASTNHYARGEVVGPFENTRFFANKIIPNGNQSVEDLLEHARPKTKYSRVNAVYAFADPGQCISFLRGEGAAQFYLYKVAMDSTTFCPMLLVDLIREHKSTAQVYEALIKEYWEPVREWRVMEYLAGTLKILAEVAKDEYMIQSYTADLAYQSDMKQGSELVSSILTSIQEIDIP
jgi:hypothetical protein